MQHAQTLPAHQTKHLPSLEYPFLDHTFHIAQSDDGRSNGTALWLGAQILSHYLAYQLKLPSLQSRPRAVELGSGVGLTALVLSALGYDVLATDTPHVCNSVLRHNIAVNTAGAVQVRELDWTVDSDRWSWNDPIRITPTDGPSDTRGTSAHDLLAPPFDLIISSDTLYDASLIQPFFRTVRALAASSRGTKPPLFLLALERRDPQLIDAALACAPVPLTQVPIKKIRKALERAQIQWDTSDWEGVEIWKGSLDV
ncbi:hypothetical protein OG21DRAFT_1475539 [Imleria badia]|nr:hypothetical protein OG21DRAFT_1475539 [Imleria badia]